MLTLVVGNKNYSTWSMRAWVALRAFDIPFEEVKVYLYEPGSKERILQYSPSGKVPALVVNPEKSSSNSKGKRGFVVWDSLAIAEYLAETYPSKNLWPKDAEKRALARSMCAEMHSGFSALRSNMSMNIKKHYGKEFGRNPEVMQDVKRITEMWEHCLTNFAKPDQGKPFLFGEFSLADAFFCPVMVRFTMFDIELPPASRAYCESLRKHPAILEWIELGLGFRLTHYLESRCILCQESRMSLGLYPKSLISLSLTDPL